MMVSHPGCAALRVTGRSTTQSRERVWVCVYKRRWDTRLKVVLSLFWGIFRWPGDFSATTAQPCWGVTALSQSYLCSKASLSWELGVSSISPWGHTERRSGLLWTLLSLSIRSSPTAIIPRALTLHLSKHPRSYSPAAMAVQIQL